MNNNKIITDVDYDLSIIHVIHGVGFAFGFQALAEMIHFVITDGFLARYSAAEAAGVLLALIAMLSVGLRLFWAISNIRRYVDRIGGFVDEKHSRSIVLFHFPVIVVQAFLFFLACSQLRDTVSMGMEPDSVRSWIITVTLLLTLNAAWLLALNFRNLSVKPEYVWFLNNSITSAALFVLLLIPLPCGLTSLIWVAAIVLLANSGVDLTKTSKWYIDSRRL